MKRFLAFVKKEFYHIWRDPRTLLILIGMPVVQILLFGFAITNEIRDARIAILDQSKDLHSRQIIAKIQASGYFVLTDPLSSHQQIETTFRDGKTKIVLVIGPGLASSLEQTGLGQVQLIADASDPNMANTLVNYLQAILASYTSELNASKLLPMQVDVRTRMRYNPELKGVYYFVPGLIAILLMLVSAMMTSISIAREKELGTMEVLLASPMSPVQIILAKVVPYLLLSFLDALLILGLGLWVF
ncbi:MAG: ABC transporter permease, partial [Cyclobacteriaceae bacterium]|nr:ABC transporter permease [Cyclobacteriaceae bacterium]